jgi:hypothetical protein
MVHFIIVYNHFSVPFFITEMDCCDIHAYIPCLWPGLIIVAGFIIYMIIKQFI